MPRKRSDWALVVSECRRCAREGTTISDGCARTIGALFYESETGLAFVSTGTVPYAPERLLGELFPNTENLPTATATVVEQLNRYLVGNAGRGRVQGWSELWVEGR